MKDYLRRHIWILSKLYENPKGLTYKEFEYEWGRTELNSLKTPLPKLDKTEHVPPLKTVKSVQFWS